MATNKKIVAMATDKNYDTGTAAVSYIIKKQKFFFPSVPFESILSVYRERTTQFLTLKLFK